jgi:hypothetical protein
LVVFVDLPAGIIFEVFIDKDGLIKSLDCAEDKLIVFTNYWVAGSPIIVFFLGLDNAFFLYYY